MAYRIDITPTAYKQLKRLPASWQMRIRDKLAQVAEAPYAPNNNVKALKSRPAFRLRVGDWRVIYELHDDRLVLVVLEVGARGGIYE